LASGDQQNGVIRSVQKGPGKTTYIVSTSFCYGNGYIWQAILT